MKTFENLKIDLQDEFNPNIFVEYLTNKRDKMLDDLTDLMKITPNNKKKSYNLIKIIFRINEQIKLTEDLLVLSRLINEGINIDDIRILCKKFDDTKIPIKE
jgi:hypothetical protein